MSQSHRLGDLQLAIMRVLWANGEAAASDVHKALLDERGLAITTIKTMLRKLEAGEPEPSGDVAPEGLLSLDPTEGLLRFRRGNEALDLRAGEGV